MTLREFLETLTSPDMLRIVKDGKSVFVGYLGLLKTEKELLETYGGQQVQRFRAVPEVTHRKWEKLALAPPLRPDETPDYYFKDLQMKLYYQIHI